MDQSELLPIHPQVYQWHPKYGIGPKTRPTDSVKFSLNCTDHLQAGCLDCLVHCKGVSWGQCIKSWIQNLWRKSGKCFRWGGMKHIRTSVMTGNLGQLLIEVSALISHQILTANITWSCFSGAEMLRSLTMPASAKASWTLTVTTLTQSSSC